jgi:uncharacterized protein
MHARESPVKTWRTLTIDTLPDGEAVDISYLDVVGAVPGPRLTIIAGVHGTEYTSIEAVRTFCRNVDPAVIAGRITAVPVVNVPAFWARSPFVVPADGKNLNRSFPGDPGGGYTEVFAHHVFESFIAGADYLLDLHAGDLPEALEPFTLYEESPVESAARDIARAYGLGHVVRQAREGRTVGGSTSAAAADAGIPAIIAESGQNGLLELNAIDRHLAGLANVVRHLGLLEGDPSPTRPPCEHQGWHWIRTPVGGWWQPEVPVGTPVAEGELVGTVSELTGELLHEVRAPAAGVPLFLTTSPAVLADGLLLGLANGTDETGQPTGRH